jgi:carbon-monoxide dehydrogenase medium subunit
MTITSYFRPGSLQEAIDLLARHGPELLVVGGGTVAMPLINEGISLPSLVMGLRGAGLDGITETDGTLRIGATTTLTTLTQLDTIPMLAEAATQTGSWSVRNMATVGGNLFTPPPGGDVAVALLALDAEVVLAGPAGARVVALSDFFTGFMATRLGPDELLTEIRVPLTADPAVCVKFGRKHANTPAVVTVAARVRWAGDVVADARIALGAVGPHPLRAREAEVRLIGTALDPETIDAAAIAAAEGCEPFTDAIATDWYRRRMTHVVAARALHRLADRAAFGGRDA